MGQIKKLKKIFTSDALNGLLVLSPKRLKEKSTGFLALLALGIVSIIWGTTWVVSKQGVMAMPALEMAGLRQIIGGSCYLTFYLFKRDSLPKFSDILPLLVLSILNFVLSNGLSTWGVKYISAGLASIIGAIFPLWIVIIGIITTKQKPPGHALLGILLGFLGVCTIFYNHLSDFINPDFRFGIFVSFLATWSWAFGTIFTKKHAKVFNPYFGLGIQMTFSGIILFFISSFDGHYLPLAEIPKVSWFAIMYLVLFGSIIAFVCYLYALQHLPTEQTSVYAYINPIVALFTGWLVLGETLSPTIITGCVITIFGVFLVNRSFISNYGVNK